jgi:hypothetical protein
VESWVVSGTAVSGYPNRIMTIKTTKTIIAAMSILFVVSNLLIVFSEEFSIFHFSIQQGNFPFFASNK